MLISTLSCVGELVVHINMAFRKETDVHAPDDGLHRQLAMANACSTIYIALRFMATCFFAERVNQERQRSLRCLHEQSNEEFWAYDLELLVVSLVIGVTLSSLDCLPVYTGRRKDSFNSSLYHWDLLDVVSSLSENVSSLA